MNIVRIAPSFLAMRVYMIFFTIQMILYGLVDGIDPEISLRITLKKI